ncbi:C-5 cytosine-specific DNA methylase [Blyttiomyces sp. JEL0837]|nr:C-5 cytosine-specific DNA methylase [Blyttiomyces sp. JEL0837]
MTEFQKQPKRICRIAEFYSGIGGWHAAFCELKDVLGLDIEEIKPFDINENAHGVYKFNYKVEPSLQDVGRLTADDLDRMNSSIWVLSPPCQPYTRNGPRLHAEDNRSLSFIALLGELLKMENPPSYIALENVLGFERSETFELLTETLTQRSYQYKGFIINPQDMGLPNSRPRFYLLATLKKFKSDAGLFKIDNGVDVLGHVVETSSKQRRIEEFLEPLPSEDLFLSDRKLWKGGEQYDVVKSEDSRSCCFTKSYGSFARGTGSILSMASSSDIIQGAIENGYEATVTSEPVESAVNEDGTPSLDSCLEFLYTKFKTERAEGKTKHQPPPRPETGRKRISAKLKKELEMEHGRHLYFSLADLPRKMTQTHQEIELKLRLHGKEDLLKVSALISPSKIKENRDTYLDTPDRRLLSASTVLRVRETVLLDPVDLTKRTEIPRFAITLKRGNVVKEGVLTADEASANEEVELDARIATNLIKNPDLLTQVSSSNPLLNKVVSEFRLQECTMEIVGSFTTIRRIGTYEDFVIELDQTQYDWGGMAFEIEVETDQPKVAVAEAKILNNYTPT